MMHHEEELTYYDLEHRYWHFDRGGARRIDDGHFPMHDEEE